MSYVQLCIKINYIWIILIVYEYIYRETEILFDDQDSFGRYQSHELWYSSRKEEKNEEIIIYKSQLRLIMRHMQRRKSFCCEKTISSSWCTILFISDNNTNDYGETEVCKSAIHNDHWLILNYFLL